jgi:phosphodiesterase/alkaline phosphatase D-like protein
MSGKTRREVLQGGAGIAAVSMLGTPWMEAADAVRPANGDTDAGAVEHLLPTVSHNRLRLKASFTRRQSDAPRLRVGGKTFAGRESDTHGRFWQWDVAGLKPDSRYTLRLLNGRGRDLTEPWRLRTFPAPDARPRRLRLLIFTCGGGHDLFREFDLFQPVKTRNRLLRRGLAFEPDAVIANGDQIYFDLEAGAAAAIQGGSELAHRRVGRFNPSLPALGSSNEQVLLRAAGPQIVPLYGTECRSVPMFFLTDDHDYFENDEASDQQVTFPPPWWKLQLARATQRLYYPEFIPVEGQPDGLPFMTSGGSRRGLSECFGALRYGRLLEFLMYDVRRTMTLAGPSAVFIDNRVEQWVTRRLADKDVRHVVNMPSNPMGWSAGKWGEWYPDVLDNGRLTESKPKPYWQAGWLSQHDRILTAVSGRKHGAPLLIGGDIHATAAATVTRTGNSDLGGNPVELALSGTLGTGPNTFPSAFRGTPPRKPGHLDIAEQIAPIEENGFTIADFSDSRIVLRFFRWNSRSQPVSDIDTLDPFRTIEVKSAG